MFLLMPELLTTDEAAIYLRLSERKLYELVANAAVPCSKVTGRWLFPRAALDRWVTAAVTILCWNGRCARAAADSRACPKEAKKDCGG
jgi:excisionase family DNA binding protein